MSTSTPARSTRRAPPSTQQRTMLIMLLIPGSIVLVLMSAMMFGEVSGNEFCPQDFAYRSFRFNQIPLVHIQVTPVYRNDKTNALIAYLTTNKLLPATTEKIRWDLTDGRRGQFAMATSGAEILQRYLSANDSQSSLYWMEWSIRRPEEAKVLWPVVAKLARSKQYPLVPEAFGAARFATNEKHLAKLLAERIAPQLHERALDASQNKQPDEARAIWDVALELDPSQAEWRSLRDALPPPAKVETAANEATPKEGTAEGKDAGKETSKDDALKSDATKSDAAKSDTAKNDSVKDSGAKEPTTEPMPTQEQPAKEAPQDASTTEKAAPEKQESTEPKQEQEPATEESKDQAAEAAPAYQSTPTSDAAPSEPPGSK